MDGKIDQLQTNHNQAEVKSDMQQLQTLAAVSHTQEDLRTQHKEILKQVDSTLLQNIIKEIGQTTTGEWKTDAEIQAHPSYDLVTQLCLDYLGYTDTQIDSDYKSGTETGVKKWEEANNLKSTGQAGGDFFRSVAEALQKPGPSPVLSANEQLSLQHPKLFLYEHATNTQRAALCYTYLTHDLGFSDIIAAGILGNMYIESFVAQKNERFSTTALGDRSEAYGLCQRAGSRRRQLLQFARVRQLPVELYTVQLDFIKREFEHGEKSARRKIQKAQTVEEATTKFLHRYERASVPKTEQRVAFAKEICAEQTKNVA